MKNKIISLRYDYSPKKVRNICKYLLESKPLLSDLKTKISTLFDDSKRQVVPYHYHRKGESHKSKSVRTTKLPGGFFPSKKTNRAWAGLINYYLKENPLDKKLRVVRYYFHVKDSISGVKFLRVSRKSIRAAKRKHTVTIYLELS